MKKDNNKIIYILMSFSIAITPLISYQKEFFWSKIAFFNFCLCFACSAIFFNKKQKKASTPLLIGPAIALFIYIIFSTFFIATNPYQSLFVSILPVSCMILYFILILFPTERSLYENIIFFLFLSSIVVSIYGLLQYFRLVSIPTEFYGEKDPGSTFNRTNQAAQFLVIALPVFIAKTLGDLFYPASENRYSRVLWPIGTIIIIFYFIAAQARGSWVGLFAAILISILIFYAKKRNEPLLSSGKKIALGVVIFILIGFVSSSNLSKKFSAKDSSMRFRFLAWESCIDMIADNPWFGVGVGNFITVFPKYQNTELESMKLEEKSRVMYAHNDYLQIMSEYGIIGVLIFLWMGFFIFKIGEKCLAKTNDPKTLLTILGVIGGIAGLLTHAIFSYNFSFPVPLICFIFLVSFLEAELTKPKKLCKFAAKCAEKEEANLPDTKGSLLIFLPIAMTLIFTVYAAKMSLSERLFADGSHESKNLSVKTGIALINRSIGLNPYNDRAFYERGIANRKLENFELSEKDFKKSLSLFPYHGNGYRQLGLTYLAMKRYKEAKEAFDKALEITPGLRKRIKRDLKKL